MKKLHYPSMTNDDLKSVIAFGMTSAEKREYVRYSISAHDGKMTDIMSISTSVKLNPFCQKRIQSGIGVCPECYANALTSMRKTLREKLEKNTTFYTSVEIAPEDVPRIYDKYFRFEAFGDVNNALQVRNYLTITRQNQNTRFALWSKNLHILAAVFQAESKPKNLQVVFSIAKLNFKPSQGWLKWFFTKYWFVDKIFIVHTCDGISRGDVLINCGSRDCYTCGVCYKKNKVRVINEKLK